MNKKMKGKVRNMIGKKGVTKNYSVSGPSLTKEMKVNQVFGVPGMSQKSQLPKKYR